MTTRREIDVNVMPNEVLFPGASIIVESRRALDRRAAQGGIVVQGVRGNVRVTRRGRTASWSPEKPLAPGHHLLLVRGLQTEKGRAIADTMSIPFFVTDSRARIPRSLRVESLARLRVGEFGTDRLPPDRRPEGKFIELMKASHRESGAPAALAFDQAGKPVDAERIFARQQKARVRNFGKLHETLHARVQKTGPRTRLQVALWLGSVEEAGIGLKKERGETRRPPRQALAQMRATQRTVRAFVARISDAYLERELRPDPMAPVVHAELTPAEIESLAKDREIIGIFLHETDGIEDLSDSIAIANSNDVHSLGYKGSGVKVAVWESGPDDTSNLSIAASYKTSGASTSQHARHTHGIVKNVEKNAPHGHAPSCTLYSANDKNLAALRWAALDKGCTVISQSFHRSSEPGSSTMSYDDIYKDWLALRWPYPTIVQAAGNYWNGDSDNISPPSDEYVNHKGYNGLAVGNHDDNAAAMAGDSVFRNPSSTHGDRELPEIAANGTSVTTVGLTMSGTSMAAPAVAGCAALIQSVDSTLKSWPEGCRAILLAAAKRNVAGNTWWQDVLADADAADGTGAVDALEGTYIAKGRRRRGAAGSPRGWDVGTLRSSDIGSHRRTTFSHFVTVPSGRLGPRRIKVALAWDGRIKTLSILGMKFLVGSVLAVDLDLQIFDSRGVQVGYSGSWDNSYEVAEFTGNPGETYTIKIRRWSGTDDVWYGIAWTVTGGLMWADVTRATALEQLISRRRG